MSLTITLSWPEPCLWSNRTRYHWSERARAKREANQEAYVCTRKALESVAWGGGAPGGDIRITITGHKPRNRVIDRDNLQAALKAGLDGVAQALLVDDSRFRPQTDWGDPAPPRGSVTVEVLDPEQDRKERTE